MKNINVIKQGTVINLSIDGKLHKKVCGSTHEADGFYKLVLKAKEDPSDENLKAIRCYLNEKIRIAMEAGLETDPETNEIYLAGFNTPVPMKLVEVIKEYNDNGYPMDAVLNFWKLLMLNPDVRVRKDLFDFISTHDFVLTDKGYMVVYKAVYNKTVDKEASAFAEFLSTQCLQVKKWSKSPNAYVVYRDNDTKDLFITKKKTANKWDEVEKGVEILGKLGDLHDSIFNAEDKADNATPVYTDIHSKTMTIELGVPVKIDRKDCDADFRKDCSYGLHVGATAYVERFANRDSTVLVCYVNPANVVAVPQTDHSKMRVAEYFPFAVANWDGSKIDIIEQAYFESDYSEYELDELEIQLAKVYAEQKPIADAQNAEAEVRPMSELLKVIETRLVDIEAVDVEE